MRGRFRRRPRRRDRPALPRRRRRPSLRPRSRRSPDRDRPRRTRAHLFQRRSRGDRRRLRRRSPQSDPPITLSIADRSPLSRQRRMSGSTDYDVIVARARPVVDSIVDLIGNTPLIRLRRLEPKPGVEIWGKCEFANPGGSVKDRAARQMILDAIADGRLTKDKTLIDSTSGNTGVAYSMIGAALGYRGALVMPENVSVARKQITSAYGTQLIFSSEMEGSDGAIRLVREIVEKDPDKYFYPDQYSNESNPRAHYLTTGAELIDALGDRLTHFVAGIGTSGTVMGTGRRLKEHRQGITVIAVEPD